jgi:3',5'-cyclic-AMP phosphodiesterase
LESVKRIVHISDLHLGRTQQTDDRAAQLAWELLSSSIDCVIATGNLTHHGKRTELRLFEDLFARLIREKRLIAVPGDRDRLGDDLAWAIMPGPRVQTVSRPGLHVVRVNSTSTHRRGQASLDDADLNAIDAALDTAPVGAVTVLALHHDPVRLPTRGPLKRLSSWVDYSMARELNRGSELLARIDGRCDLVLHGRRSDPRGTRIGSKPRPMSLFNAGSSTESGHVYVFTHDAVGGLRGGAMWLDARGLAALGTVSLPPPARSAPSLMVA